MVLQASERTGRWIVTDRPPRETAGRAVGRSTGAVPWAGQLARGEAIARSPSDAYSEGLPCCPATPTRAPAHLRTTRVRSGATAIRRDGSDRTTRGALGDEP